MHFALSSIIPIRPSNSAFYTLWTSFQALQISSVAPIRAPNPDLRTRGHDLRRLSILPFKNGHTRASQRRIQVRQITFASPELIFFYFTFLNRLQICLQVAMLGFFPNSYTCCSSNPRLKHSSQILEENLGQTQKFCSLMIYHCPKSLACEMA